MSSPSQFDLDEYLENFKHEIRKEVVNVFTIFGVVMLMLLGVSFLVR